MAYQVAGVSFRTKRELVEHFRAVRHRTKFRQEITDPVVLQILRLHPQWESKSRGLKYVSTALIKGDPSAGLRKEIVLLRHEQEPMDISWSKLIPMLQADGTLKHPPSDLRCLDELRIAARQAIYPQLQHLLEPNKHVDHVYPNTFEKLLYDWVSRSGLRVRDIGICSNDGTTIRRWFADAQLQKSWELYHKCNAVLRVLTPKEHAKQPVLCFDWSPLL